MKRFFLLVVIACTSSAIGEESASSPDVSPVRVRQDVFCGTGLRGGGCRLAQGIVQAALHDLRVEIPGWRWVVVPATQWKQTAESFGVKPTVPAFSSFAVSTTYIESNLIFPDLRTDENLQHYTSRVGSDRLEWVLAHESGHVVCRTSDDRKAESAGKRIKAGNRAPCE
jgi:hypothetical protein